MSDDTLIERVARALYECRTWIGAWDGPSISEVEREAWKYDARAAITAIDAYRAEQAERAVMKGDDYMPYA